ncbi:MAG: redoxin domain-containing protein [Deltaproteobacteria bacterium]|nr:MAG: redoxin domain-containing protein [Deltaproteobacteria bacterium]
MRFALVSLALIACGSAEPPAEAAAPAAEPAQEAAPEAATTAATAPAFELTDLDGNTHTLDSLKGKVVVLEWFNPGCPFVKAAHGEGPLSDMASRWGDKEVVWLAVNSGAPGKQGHGVDVNKAAVAEWSMTHPVLLDETGTVGKAYGAKTTPQMVIIDPEGNIAYEGALDNAPMGDVKGGGDRVPYTDNALVNVLDGKPAKPDQTTPWGCSVKYAS